MNIKAVIFDLDGTLLDTLEDIADACNASLQKHGFPIHPVEAYKTFVGDGVPTLISRVLPQDAQHSERVKETLMTAYRDEYHRTWNVKTHAYAGIPELLKQLGRHHIPMAVLSNKPDDFTKRCVKEFLKEVPFEIVQGASPAFPRKPDPAAALHIAQQLGAPAHKVHYLGDTSTDMQTAVAAGMIPVGVTWGFRSAEELQAHGAKYLIGQPEELLKI